MTCIEELAREVRLLNKKFEEVLQAKAAEATYSTAEFGQLMGRSARWVGAHCASGRIHSITKKHPFKIPHRELERIRSEGI